ncbi:MAG: hypothetical protein KDA45_16090, partial [Planctomycetales bacterium]|nr:hypothetical protein [Planctomycetales bacterium]
LQGNHPRGHLTQYLALYTSLSTNYSIDFPENGSVALPFGDLARTRRRATVGVRHLRTNYGRSQGVTLEPVTVYSNSTEMLHAEQMVELPGGLLLGQSAAGKAALKNSTGLQLRGAMVLRLPQAGVLETAWIGDLPAGQAASLDFVSSSPENLWEWWNREPATRWNASADRVDADSNERASESLQLGGLLNDVVRKTPLLPGQTRLFAYTDDRPGQLTVSPTEDQFDRRCLIVAHLTPHHLGTVQPDIQVMSRTTSDLPVEHTGEPSPQESRVQN